MKVLLTGADGLLGSNVTRELLTQGYEVRAFLLEGVEAVTLEGLPIEKVYGNLLNADSVKKAMKGCSTVIHAAANTSIWPDRSAIVRKVNIDGTRHIIDAALQHNIQRLVYIGTANSFGFGSKDNPGDETRPYASAKYGLDYMDSKREAQQLVLKAVEENDLPALTVNPTFMLGPYDSKPSAGRMVLSVAKGKVPGYTTGGRNYVAVKDVAKAIVNGLKRGSVGESYIGGHLNLNYKEAFSMIAEVVGVKAPALYVPSFASRLYGGIGSTVSKLTNKAPVVSLAMAKISTDEHYFTAAKAVEELGLPQTDVREAIRESYEWMMANGVTI